MFFKKKCQKVMTIPDNYELCAWMKMKRVSEVAQIIQNISLKLLKEQALTPKNQMATETSIT